jgi:hypothetical protein
MRNRNLLMLVGALLATALATPAVAGSLYRWTAPDGSVSFTDDPKRIPESHREGAERIATRGLDDYGRYTPTRPAEGSDYTARLAERLERLRAINRPVAGPQAEGTPSSTILRLDEHTSLAIPNDAAGGEGPIVVEERRVRDANSITTQHVTVVRRGDEVLSVIKPRSSVGTTHPPSLEDFVD